MQERLNLLFIFSAGFDIDHSSTILMRNALEDALKRGYNVHYYAPQSAREAVNYPQGLENSERLSYDSLYIAPASKWNLPLRYIKLVEYGYRIRKFLNNKNDYDVVYIQSTPAALWIINSVKKYNKNVPCIYSVLDMFPGSTIASGKMPLKIMQNFFYGIQDSVFKKATHIMTMSYDMKLKVQACGVAPDKITAWDTWFDHSTLRIINDEDNTFISEFGMDKNNKFYIQYAGNVGYVYDVDTLIAVARRLADRKEFVFQLVARGSQLPYVNNLISKYKLTNIQIIPLQPVNRVSEVYSACDIQFIPLKRGVMGNSFPSKLAHVMAVGKSFICSIDKTVFFDIAAEKKIGFCFEIGDIDGIVSCIKKAYANRDILKNYGNNALLFARERYSRERNTKIILDTIEKVAAEARKK